MNYKLISNLDEAELYDKIAQVTTKLKSMKALSSKAELVLSIEGDDGKFLVEVEVLNNSTAVMHELSKLGTITKNTVNFDNSTEESDNISLLLFSDEDISNSTTGDDPEVINNSNMENQEPVVEQSQVDNLLFSEDETVTTDPEMDANPLLFSEEETRIEPEVPNEDGLPSNEGGKTADPETLLFTECEEDDEVENSETLLFSECDEEVDHEQLFFSEEEIATPAAEPDETVTKLNEILGDTAIHISKEIESGKYLIQVAAIDDSITKIVTDTYPDLSFAFVVDPIKEEGTVKYFSRISESDNLDIDPNLSNSALFKKLNKDKRANN